MKTLRIALASLLLASVAFFSGDVMSKTAKADCCDTGAECCYPGSPCCE